jgi:hypothetical protein
MMDKLKRWVSLALMAAMLVVTAAPTAQARFLNPDTWDPWQEGVDFNRYGYAGDDPINKSDPNGHEQYQTIIDNMFGCFNCSSGYANQNLQTQMTNVGTGVMRIEAGVTIGAGVVATGMAAPLIIETAPALMSAYRTFRNLERVGRWMSEKEYAAMVRTGRVQEGTGGITNVASPPRPYAFRSPRRNDRYVEFDTLKGRLNLKDKELGWKYINGPNSMLGRLNRPGQNLAMPPARNISQFGTNGSSSGSGSGLFSSLGNSLRTFLSSLFGK